MARTGESPRFILYLLAQPKQHQKRCLENNCAGIKQVSMSYHIQDVCLQVTCPESGSAKQTAALSSLPTTEYVTGERFNKLKPKCVTTPCCQSWVRPRPWSCSRHSKVWEERAHLGVPTGHGATGPWLVWETQPGDCGTGTRGQDI